MNTQDKQDKQKEFDLKAVLPMFLGGCLVICSGFYIQAGLIIPKGVAADIGGWALIAIGCLVAVLGPYRVISKH